MRALEEYFEFSIHGTTWAREIMAGATTFLTMAYIIVVNPAILAAAGLPREASVTATVVVAAVGSLAMGVYARRPFAVAPLMGENAFVAMTVVGVLGEPWPAALGAVFWSGVTFAFLTLVGLRQTLAEAIPPSLRHAIAAGLGLFLTFIGLHSAGLVVPSASGPPVRFGDFHDTRALLATLGFLGTCILLLYRVPGGVLLGILFVTFASIPLGLAERPAAIVAWPASLQPIAGKLEFAAILYPRLWPIVLTIFIMVFVDTLATLYGLSIRAGLLDGRGQLPQIERPLLVDALATALAALLGTTTAGAYVESATGIVAGGRTGVVACVVGLLFLASLFFWPLVTAVPSHAYGPALVLVGLLMLETIRGVAFDDWTELVPSFVTIALMVFTLHIGMGMTAGFATYVAMKLAAGRAAEVPLGLWFLAGISVLFFLVAPH
ncbi:MAG: NCS2 family permease [Candidatus Binatia bacterium]|nr:NCS2 family permease [Candidatus Binatia bacterium]